MLLTSVYSMGMSGLWFVLGVTSYQFDVNRPGALSFSAASTLIAAGAKTIELSFEFVSVVIVGQELSRRFTGRSARGLNLAEMQLKAFLAQPGSMITNWQAVLHVLPSTMGITCLFISAIGILYTTASDALVSPSPTIMGLGTQHIPATVNTGFLNNTFMQKNCPSQVNLQQDSSAITTCDNIQRVGFVFRDLMEYLSAFEVAALQPSEYLSQIQHRPAPMASYSSVSSVRGMWWKDHNNTAAPVVSSSENRVFNNVTMLLPHVGVVVGAQGFVDQLIQQGQNVSLEEPAVSTTS